MFSKVKQHISNNRGKYGTAVGAGALYGASQIDTPLMNQAKFNAMAQGQNLAHNSANYIDGKLDTNLVNNLNSVGVRNIDPEQINLINQGYDKFKGTPYTGADAKDAINMAEFNSIPYTQRIASGDNVDDARMDYLNSGANFIKKSAGQVYDHMTESTGINLSKENTMKIQIKQALLEGYQPEVIVEMAVHANHPNLNKKHLENPNMSYINGKALVSNRNRLAGDIKENRSNRDQARAENKNKTANILDNYARVLSQKSRAYEPTEIEGLSDIKKLNILQSKPRVISSAKQ